MHAARSVCRVDVGKMSVALPLQHTINSRGGGPPAGGRDSGVDISNAGSCGRVRCGIGHRTDSPSFRLLRLSPNLSYSARKRKFGPPPRAGRRNREENGRGRGGEPGCFVLNDKIEAGGAARGVVRDGARGATCAGAVRLHRAAACSESLHLLEHLRQTYYKCQGLPALVQPLLAK